jgi:hypothetical protein
VPGLLLKYKGREEELLLTVQEKYGLLPGGLAPAAPAVHVELAEFADLAGAVRVGSYPIVTAVRRRLKDRTQLPINHWFYFFSDTPSLGWRSDITLGARGRPHAGGRRGGDGGAAGRRPPSIPRGLGRAPAPRSGPART